MEARIIAAYLAEKKIEELREKRGKGGRVNDENNM